MPMTESRSERSRGRPRSERARAAILDAATQLLLSQGLGAVSMDVVARRAGVSKATIYRWWPNKQTLALDALNRELDTTQQPKDTGSLRGDLLALLRPLARHAQEREYPRVIGALVSEVHCDPSFAEQYHVRFVRPRRQPGTIAFRRGIERGELSADVDVELALDLVYGPIWHRLLHCHAPLDARFVEQVVDVALAGLPRD
jgi:AcrR family transcriptional regulator